MANTLILGSDKITAHTVREILILFFSIFILSWFGSNYPSEFVRAQLFWLLGITAMIGLLIALVIKKAAGNRFDINVPIAEHGLLKIRKRYVALLAIAMFLTTFFMLSRTGYSLIVPPLQIVELGLLGNWMVTTAGLITEDFFFFSVMFGFLFSILYYFTKNPVLSLAVSAMIVPFGFVVYHIYAKGLNDVVGMVATFIFGVEMIGWQIAVRDLGIIHARHAGNNLGIITFAAMSLSTFLVLLLTNPITWIFIIIILIVVWLKLRRRG